MIPLALIVNSFFAKISPSISYIIKIFINDWFHIFPDWKIKQLNEHIAKNEEAIHLLSKQQKWITISPKTRDRRHPLEKSKVMNDENHDKLIPKWMKIRPNIKTKDNFKAVGFSPIGTKSTKMMMLVDKQLNIKKSLMNIIQTDLFLIIKILEIQL